MKKMKNVLFVAALATLVSCGGQKEETHSHPTDTPAATETPAESQTTETTPATSGVTEENGVTIVQLGANDQMQFDKNEIRAKAGQKVRLTLTHTGKMDIKAMGHNFVLIQEGVDIAFFAQAALKATDNEYIPKSESKIILAHTKLLGGGESDTIEFTVEEAGVYPFLCTFPGHWGVMQGKLIVE